MPQATGRSMQADAVREDTRRTACSSGAGTDGRQALQCEAWFDSTSLGCRLSRAAASCGCSAL